MSDLLTEFRNLFSNPTVDDLVQFVQEKAAIASNLRVPGSEVTAFYSGQLDGGVDAYRFALDLGERSGGKIAVLGNTELGQFLNEALDPLSGIIPGGVPADIVNAQ